MTVLLDRVRIAEQYLKRAEVFLSSTYAPPFPAGHPLFSTENAQAATKASSKAMAREAIMSAMRQCAEAIKIMGGEDEPRSW